MNPSGKVNSARYAPVAGWHLFILFLLSCNNPPPSSSFELWAGSVFDGTKWTLQPTRVVVTDGLITVVEHDERFAANPPQGIIDARELSLLPGLIDTHTHVFNSPACHHGEGAGVGQALRNLQAYLKSGVTTVVDLASPPATGVALRRFVGVGKDRGPRLMVAGAVHTAAGGYPLQMLGDFDHRGAVVELQNPAQAKEAALKASEHKVDVLKVALQQRTYAGAALPMMDEKTLCALVDAAHKHELKVLTHAISVAGYHRGLACNVDAFVHGSLETLPTTIIEQLKEQETPVALTFSIWQGPLSGPSHPGTVEQAFKEGLFGEDVYQQLKGYTANAETLDDTLPPMGEEGVKVAELTHGFAALQANARAMSEQGVALALGSDSSFCFNMAGRINDELRQYVAAGLTFTDALRAATTGSARLLGLQDALGRVAVGYRADLITVQNGPAQELQSVSDVAHVFIDGKLQTPRSAGCWDTLRATFTIVLAGGW